LVLIGSQFLLQLRYCLVFVYFNLSRALLIDSRASAFGYYLLQRSAKVLWTPDFINQPKPLSSFTTAGLFSLKQAHAVALPIFFEVTTNWRAGCQKLGLPGSEGGAT